MGKQACAQWSTLATKRKRCWLAGQRPEHLKDLSAIGRVRMWRGGLRYSLSVSAPFVWRCLNSRTITPFPHPPHRTGHAEYPHPALGQDSMPSHAKGHAQFTRPSHGTVLSRRVSIERSAHNRQCHHLGSHLLPGSQPGSFLHFSMWHLPQRLHTSGVY